MQPHDLLPLKAPMEQEFADDKLFFYSNVAKPLIADTIRIMNNGLPIDLNKVQELEIKLDKILEGVTQTIANNKVIQEFQQNKYPLVAAEVRAEITAKMRTFRYYMKDFDAKNAVHRSYYMYYWIQDKAHIVTPIEEVYPGIPKWSANEVKKLAKVHTDLLPMISNQLPQSNRIAFNAVKLLSTHKAAMYNKSYLDQIKDITFASVMEPFNPNSSVQKREFFEYIGIEPVEFSKDTGEPSWGRKVIEELLRGETDPDLIEILQAFIDQSFASIVRNNFIKAFYEYTVEGRLYGNYRLLGAKSGCLR